MNEAYTTSKDVAEKCDERYADSEDTLFKLDTSFIEEHIPEGATRLIDLGCGTGRHVLHFARRGLEVVGVDINRHMLDVADRKVADAGLRAFFLVTDIADPLNVQNGGYDVALCMFNTLELLEPDAQRRAVEAAYRTLRPGGAYILQVHNGNVGGKVRTSKGHQGEPKVTFHMLSEQDVRGLLEGAGFESLEFRYIDPNRAEYMEAEDAPLRAYGFLVAARKAYPPSESQP